MTFLECCDCGEAIRVLDHELRRDDALACEIAADAAGFSARHDACRVVRWTPCGESTCDRAPLEPLARWTVALRCANDPSLRATAHGARPVADGPRSWRIERPVVAEGPMQLRAAPGGPAPRPSPATKPLVPTVEVQLALPFEPDDQLALPFGPLSPARPSPARSADDPVATGGEPVTLRSIAG